jgi:hypothetical protein
MKICIARLRSGSNYVEPLNDILDSFYELLKVYRDRHPEHEFYYYNFGFNQKPMRDVRAIAEADIIIIPSEAEFTYHIPGAIHSLDLKKSNELLEDAKPFFNNKKVILLRSDRRDDEELYKTKVFTGLNIDYQTIDECDFGNVHGMKYHFIQRTNPLFETEKRYDFCYWGSDKRKTIDGVLSGDTRHIILKQIRKSDMSSFFIGRFYGFDRDMKWGKMKDILPYLRASRSTLCFNWMDSKATTSRYIEAVACGMIPFVWQDYDSTGVYEIQDWQRVESYDDFVDKTKQFLYSKDRFEEVEYNLTQFCVKSPQEYYESFDELMKEKI